MTSPGPPLRVLYLLHTAAAGGAAGSLRLLIEQLPTATVEPLVLSPNGDAVDRFRRAGIAVRHIPGVSMFHSLAGEPLRGMRLFELLRTLARMRHGRLILETFREFQPDVVHLNDRGMLHAARLAWKAGLPVVMHARSVADRKKGWVRSLGTALTRRYVDRVVAIDQSVRWSLRELEGCDVLYNPLPAGPTGVRQFAAPGGSPREAAAEPSRPRHVLYLSGLLRFKGIWDLLEAARLLRTRDDVRFLIAGANSRPPAFHRSVVGKLAHAAGLAADVESQVKQWVDRHGLTGSVQLLGHVEDTQALFDRADILVFPSHLNGPGRSVFEAGAQGIPSIVTMVDRVEDIVEDGVTGLITNERDPPALADAILRLVDGEGLRMELGQNAERKYAVQFEGKRIGQQMLEIYRSVVAASRARR